VNLVELKRLLDATGFPVAYSHFNEQKATPFITYLVTYSSNFHADNKVHKKIHNADIELYTNKKDLSAESILENILDENSIPYDTIETFIESEKLFQKIYEMRMI